MAKQGLYQILVYVARTNIPHYNEILKHCESTGVVGSRAQVDNALRILTDLELLERIVSSERPVRTNYVLTAKGKKVYSHLLAMEKEIT